MAKPLYHTIRWLGAGGQCRETPERGDLGAHVYSDGSWQSCLALVPIARMYDHPLFEAARRSNDYRLNDLLQPSGYLVNNERSGENHWHHRQRVREPVDQELVNGHRLAGQAGGGALQG